MTVGEDREGTASVVWPLLATGPGRGPPGPSDSAIARLLGIAGSPGPGRGRPGGAVQVRRVLVVYHGRPGGRRFGRGPGRRPGGGGGATGTTDPPAARRRRRRTCTRACQ